jgi:stage II sporulation protein R
MLIIINAVIIGGFIMKKITISLIIGLCLIIGLASYADLTQASLADNFIRLHVIANSDSEYDQMVKLKVRDAILEKSNNLFINCSNIKETKEKVSQNLDLLEISAKQTVAAYGQDYNVDIQTGTFYFPTKYYGDIVLPAGEYEAVKIVLGKGKGHNWWCVMFPPLCFVDSSHACMSDEVKNDLKNNMSEEDYKLITQASRNKNVNVKMKFKIVEIWNKYKEKIKVAMKN